MEPEMRAILPVRVCAARTEGVVVGAALVVKGGGCGEAGGRVEGGSGVGVFVGSIAACAVWLRIGGER